MTYLRRLNDSDKLLLGVALLNAGVKARIRKCRLSFRICFEGEQSAVLATLNNNGYRNACGEQFSRFSFNGGNEIFIHGALQ